MRLVPERTSSSRILAFVYALLALGIWAGVASGRLWPASTYCCPLLAHTGVACPSCGGIRAALALGRGDLAEAFLQNPAVTTGLVVLAAWLAAAVVVTAVPRWRRSIAWSRRDGRILRLAAGSLLAGTWIYEIVRHRW